MSDNAYTDTYGPSTPGMLEVVAGQTNGMRIVATSKKPSTLEAVSYYISDGQGGWSMINDVDPGGDVCSVKSDQATMDGRNIGDLLNDAGITWGSFMGGFDLQAKNANGSTGCARSTQSAVVGKKVTDYIPHHAWFQYFASTANPTHARPSSAAAIGYSLQADGKTADPANHGYDLTDFYGAVQAGNFPSVSYIKMPAYQDGHAGYSDPLDEQTGTVELLNFLQQQPDWNNTAVLIVWDDSDGWYDHAYHAPTAASFDPQADQVNGSGKCGSGSPPDGVAGKPVNGRCGPGHAGSVPAGLALGATKLRRSCADHPGVGGALHRGQLAAGQAAGRRVVRRDLGLADGPVRLRGAAAGCDGVPGPEDRRGAAGGTGQHRALSGAAG